MSWFTVVDVPPAVSVSLTTLPFASNRWESANARPKQNGPAPGPDGPIDIVRVASSYVADNGSVHAWGIDRVPAVGRPWLSHWVYVSVYKSAPFS